MIIDNHVHLGWYSDRYHSPREVWDSALAAGVDEMAVSSTSTCAELYKVVVREMRELIKLGGERIHPILWLTPKMMKCRYAVPYMFKSKIKWQGIKMHWGAHPQWTNNRRSVLRAIDVARKLQVPVLLHTGEQHTCQAGRFQELILDNPDLIFILAHGRPIEQTINVLQQCHNAFVDTSFMTAEPLSQIIKYGLGSRVLFGTDAPINELYFRDVTSTEYIKGQIDIIKYTCGEYADEILSRTVFCNPLIKRREARQHTAPGTNQDRSVRHFLHHEKR